MKQTLKLLLVDFDGVLSNGKFYNSTDAREQKLGEKTIAAIFTPQNEQLLNDWMRGAISYKEVHGVVAARTGLSARDLDALLEASVKRMPLNEPLLAFIAMLRTRGVAVSLFTNNMDIFDGVSRTHHELDRHFDHIYSSSDFRQLKLEDDVLLKRAITEARSTVAQTAFVDDSQASYDAATSYGVKTFTYKPYENSQAPFESWLAEEFTW